MRQLMDTHGVTKDLQLSVGASPCAKFRVFVECFRDKDAVKAESPDMFNYAGSSTLTKKVYGAQLALVWADAARIAESQPVQLANPGCSSFSEPVMSRVLRQKLCSAYAEVIGSGKQPSVAIKVETISWELCIVTSKTLSRKRTL